MAALVKGPALPQPGGDMQTWAGRYHAGLTNLLTTYSRAINSNAVATNVAVADLPTTGQPGEFLYVPDAAGGGIPAFWDGSAWRRFDTRAVVT